MIQLTNYQITMIAAVFAIVGAVTGLIAAYLTWCETRRKE